ncbi:MAG: hypothetical protein EOP04_06650 [Proteobacteria bacterium]|nr:MAG: hypothetical protein EOP04_06650 [Pseudomonadota bacterium]
MVSTKRSARECLLIELESVYEATKMDLNTDWGIEENVDSYLDDDLTLIGTVIEFFDRCQLFELKLRLTSVILFRVGYKPAYDLSIQSGRAHDTLYMTYESVRQMVKEGVIKI